MRAVVCNAFEGISALSLVDTVDPELSEDEIAIDVHAASVSYMDYLMVNGRYQLRPALPYVPGTDAAGVVAARRRETTARRFLTVRFAGFDFLLFGLGALDADFAFVAVAE